MTGIAQAVCGLMGMHLYAVGTTLRPVDQSFKGFDIAEGCSGIRSLMAMVMVTAIYVHLTQTKLWKKVTILFLLDRIRDHRKRGPDRFDLFSGEVLWGGFCGRAVS